MGPWVGAGRGKKQRGAEDALCLIPILRRGNVRLGMRLVQGHPVCHRARIITQDVRLPLLGMWTSTKLVLMSE